jgi:hypothetical protein
MEYILAAVGFIVGWIVGAKFTRAILQRVFSEILNDLNIGPDNLRSLAEKYGMKVAKIESDETTGEEHEIVEVKIEEHHGQLYAFRKDTDKFLGQGANREELIERLKHEFSGTVKMIIREADGAELIRQPS